MRRVGRWAAALASTSLAAVLLLAASAQAATSASSVTVITEHASDVTASTAVLHGVIDTGGVKTEWQFQFGRTISYNRGTPIKTIPAGSKTVPVSFPIEHLDPSTTYHFRLVAITSTSSGPHRTTGRDETFTTKSAGRLLLHQTRLSVRNGQVSVPFTCASTLSCEGRFRIGTRAKLGKTVASVLCATGSYAIPADGRQTVRTRVRRACLVLLHSSKHRRLIATLSSHPSSGQHELIRTVVVVLG
jgi:hypothetical protein